MSHLHASEMLMEPLNKQACWVAFDRQKRLFDAPSGRYGKHLRSFDAVRRAVGEPKPLRDYYLGLALDATTDCLCIDIDRNLSPDEIEQILNRLYEAIGHRDISAEYSLSGNLHLFLRIPFHEIPAEFRHARGRFMGYPAEFYATRQAILLTENWIPHTQPVFQIQKPTRWNAIAQWCLTCSNPSPTTQPSQVQTSSFPDNEPDYQPKRRNIFLDILHLFPSFYAPYLKDYYVNTQTEFPDRIHLRRPGKQHGTSATAFLNTGIIYNFSTNWTPLPHHQGITLAEFIAHTQKRCIRQVAIDFYRYLKETSQALGIPIPRRKSRHYFNLKKKHYYQFVGCFILYENPLLDIKTLRQHIQTITQHKVSAISLQKHFYELLARNIVQRTRIPRTNRYGYTLTERGKTIIEYLIQTHERLEHQHKIQPGIPPVHLDLGWNLVLFVIETYAPNPTQTLHQFRTRFLKNLKPDRHKPKTKRKQKNKKEKPQDGEGEESEASPPSYQTFRPCGKSTPLRFWFLLIRMARFWVDYYRYRRFRRCVGWNGFGSAWDWLQIGVSKRWIWWELEALWREAYLREGSFQAYLVGLQAVLAMIEEDDHAFQFIG